MSNGLVKDKILVFIPAYNCEGQIGRVLKQFSDPLIAELFDTVLVLDNHSQDNTLKAAVEAKALYNPPNCLIGHNAENYGLGGSHKVAFSFAQEQGFTHVVVLHGDDQGDIQDLAPVIRQGSHRNQDACLGARFMRGSRLSGYSRFRIFGNYIFNTLFSIGTGHSVRDLGSGLNLFSKKLFSDTRIHNYPDDLSFNVLLLLGALDTQRKLMFFPISWREDDQVSNVKMVSQATGILTFLLNYMFQRKRIRQNDYRKRAVAEYRFDLVDGTFAEAGK